MNRVNLVGRLTKDIELRLTQTQKAVARFTIAINRRGQDAGTDFINCIAWNQTAELLEKYVRKGDRLGACGRIQTGSYKDKDGKTVYTTDVVVDEIEFLESKRESSPARSDSDGFMPVPDDVSDEGLPFN